MYHALEPDNSVIAVSPAIFSRQMRWLHDNHYRTLSLSTLTQYLDQKQALPPRSVVITFDDGFESVYSHAFPILSEYNFSATIFLVSDYCGGQNNWPNQPALVPPQRLMRWSQIQEMDRHGIEFGGHTLSHPWLNRLTVNQVVLEVQESKAAIEDKLGHAIEHFAYPYGQFNDVIKTMVGDVYRSACTTQLGMVDLTSDPLALARIEAQYVSHPLIFQKLLAPSFSYYLLLRRWLRTIASTLLRRPWK